MSTLHVSLPAFVVVATAAAVKYLPTTHARRVPDGGAHEDLHSWGCFV